jgi:hypothetical protein
MVHFLSILLGVSPRVMSIFCRACCDAFSQYFVWRHAVNNVDILSDVLPSNISIYCQASDTVIYYSVIDIIFIIILTNSRPKL